MASPRVRRYGPHQDNSTVSVPSRVKGEAITIQEWLTVGGCETGSISVDPQDPGVYYANCYGGRLTRFDVESDQEQQIGPYPVSQLGIPSRDLEFRFQWNAPVLASEHHADVIYYASQVVHRSTDEGRSLEVISPELTRYDTTKMGEAGEPITRDMTGVEIYPTVFTLAEDEHDPDVLWAGTNDGLIHVSRAVSRGPTSRPMRSPRGARSTSSSRRPTPLAERSRRSTGTA